MRKAWSLLGIAICVGVQPARAQDTYRPANGTLLQIEAQGTAKAPPDEMSVSASVVTTGTTAAQALDRNNQLTARLIEAVKTSKIGIAHLQTTELEVKPRFAGNKDGDDETPARIVGYVARNSLDVELADVAQAGDLISRMFEAGANEITGPNFSLRDPVPAQRKAEQAAIAQSRAEAENYAAALNMKVSRVLRIFDRGFYDDTNRNSIVVTGSRIRATPIEPADITFTATIHVEYLLEPR